MIHKHEIPILEFDDNPQAVIMPTHEGLDLHLPEKCVYAFLEDEIDRFAKTVGAEQVATFVSATKAYPVYVLEHQGEESLLGTSASWICTCCPIHGLVDWLWGEENHFLRKLWRLGGHRRKCLFDPDQGLAR